MIAARVFDLLKQSDLSPLLRLRRRAEPLVAFLTPHLVAAGGDLGEEEAEGDLICLQEEEGGLQTAHHALSGAS